MVSLSLSLGLGVLPRGAGTVAPTTVQFTYAQIAGAIHGAVDYTGTAGKTSFSSSADFFIGGAITLLITGTAADILMYQNVNSQPAGMVQVSVDGGAFATASIVSGRYVLFTGLSNTEHLVVIQIDQAYGGSANMPNTGNVLGVTGAPPSIATVVTTVQSGDNNANTFSTNTLMANGRGGTYTPANVLSTDTNVRCNVPALALRGDPTAMVVTTRGRYVFVSTDGATPVRYDGGTNTSPQRFMRAVKISGLSGTKTYHVWGSLSDGGSQQCAVALIGGTGLVNIATKQRLEQYGDSITEGTTGAASAGATDTFRVASALGYLGANYGFGGNTVAQLLARIPTILGGKSGTSSLGANDVAVIAIGRNNVGGSFSAGVIADYQAIVNALLTAGYRRVICRGILPEGGNTWPSENASISSIVTGFADARVKFCDTSGWSGIATSDGTHPTEAGYATITTYALASYPALIA